MNKKCCNCNNDVWKGDKYNRNYWQLYCKECEDNLVDENNNMILRSIKDTIQKHKSQGDIDSIQEEILFSNIKLDLINNKLLIKNEE